MVLCDATTARNAWYISCSLRATKNTQSGVSTLGVHTQHIFELQYQSQKMSLKLMCMRFSATVCLWLMSFSTLLPKKGAPRAPSSAQSSFPTPASSLDLSCTAGSLESRTNTQMTSRTIERLLCCNFLPNKRVRMLYYLERMPRGLLEVSGPPPHLKQVSDQVSVSSQGLSISQNADPTSSSDPCPMA